MKEETRKKISETLKRKGIFPRVRFVGIGKNNPMYGKHQTDEAKEKNRIAHLGKSTWMKGKRHTKKALEKMSKTWFKKGVSSWNKGKPNTWPHPFKPMYGSKNPAWKGGVSKIGQRLRTTTEYGEWRKKVFLKDDYTCRICFIRGEKKNDPLQADHIKQFAYYPELRLKVSNGRTVHKNCHRKLETWGRRILLNA